MLKFVSRCWCRLFHKKVFRPVRGKYVCAACFCEWPVNWDTSETKSEAPAWPVYERRQGDRRRACVVHSAASEESIA
jgi:hypothetical protein